MAEERRGRGRGRGTEPMGLDMKRMGGMACWHMYSI